jgi:hypothetical protein
MALVDYYSTENWRKVILSVKNAEIPNVGDSFEYLENEGDEYGGEHVHEQVYGKVVEIKRCYHQKIGSFECRVKVYVDVE